MHRPSIAAAAFAIGIAFTGSAIAQTSEEPAEFVVKAPDGNVLQLRTGASMKAKAEGAPELLDGATVRNLGCKEADGSRWCLVQYERSDAYGWAATSALEPAAPFEIGAGSGKPLTKEEMPNVCRAEASKSFGGSADQIELLAAKSESGGLVIAGTIAVKQEEEPGLAPFKCFFDKEQRFSDVMSLISDGE